MHEPRIVTVTLNPAIDRTLEAARFSIGQTARTASIGRHPAGKGINVARVLGVLGTPCIAAGLVGLDELRAFEEFLTRIGAGRITTRLLPVPGTTRQNITIRDPVLNTETHIREQGFTIRAEDVRLVCEHIAALAREGSIITFAGSLPPGFQTVDHRDLIRRCTASGARIVVDAADEVIAALRGERLWMVRLNAAELATLAGLPTETREACIAAARAMCSSHGGTIDRVIVSRGADGAILIGPDIEIACRVSLDPARIASTVGCGDALLAGLLHEWASTGQWDQALRRGVAVATAAAVAREPGSLSLDDAAAFWHAATIESLH